MGRQENRDYVVTGTGVSKEASSGVFDGLDFFDSYVGLTMEEAIAQIKA